MVYMQMLFALGFDKLVFDTTPSALSIIGSSLILGSAVYVAMHKADGSKNVERRRGQEVEEERGLMSPDLTADVHEEEQVAVEMRPLR
jgi:hypothetical protein